MWWKTEIGKPETEALCGREGNRGEAPSKTAGEWWGYWMSFEIQRVVALKNRDGRSGAREFVATH